MSCDLKISVCMCFVDIWNTFTKGEGKKMFIWPNIYWQRHVQHPEPISVWSARRSWKVCIQILFLFVCVVPEMAVWAQVDPRLERLCIKFGGVSSINFHNVCNECPFICILYANVNFLIALNFNLGTMPWLGNILYAAKSMISGCLSP